MFNFGDDKEDELKENMEEIKNLVDRQEKSDDGGQPTKEELENDLESFEDEQDFSEGEAEEQNQEPEVASFEDSPQQQTNGQGGEDSFDEEFGNQGFGDQSNQAQEPQPEPEPEPQNPQPDETQDMEKKTQQSQNRTTQPETSSGTLNDALPEPPETRDIDVPEIQKGPLFIRQTKFRSAQNMIQEMRYLSREMEEVVNQLEEGIRQDQQTEREAREILHTMEEDRTDVKDIIMPEKKADGE